MIEYTEGNIDPEVAKALRDEFTKQADAWEAMYKALGVPFTRSNNTVGASTEDLTRGVVRLVERVEALERALRELSAQ